MLTLFDVQELGWHLLQRLECSMDFRLKCIVPTITSLSACNHLVLIVLKPIYTTYKAGLLLSMSPLSWVVTHQGSHTECNVGKYSFVGYNRKTSSST